MTDLIERELDLDASPATVWQAMTDPAWLAGWLADEVELELRPGGEARFCFGEEHRSGWVEEVSGPGADSQGVSDPEADGQDEPEAARLVFWWTRDDQPASRVELRLTPLPDGATRLRVAESRPLEVLDLAGMPLPGNGGVGYGPLGYGPALVAA